jgi:hypothetical protein
MHVTLLSLHLTQHIALYYLYYRKYFKIGTKLKKTGNDFCRRLENQIIGNKTNMYFAISINMTVSLIAFHLAKFN